MKLIAVLQGPARLMRNQTLRTLESGSMVIGRAATADWVITDPERIVSSSHCRIAVELDQFVVTDTSTNGVFVNSEAVGFGLSKTLLDGAVLRLGDATIRISIETGAAARERPGPARAEQVSRPQPSSALLADPFGGARTPSGPSAPNPGLPAPAAEPELLPRRAAPAASGPIRDDWWADEAAGNDFLKPGQSAKIPDKPAPIGRNPVDKGFEDLFVEEFVNGASSESSLAPISSVVEMIGVIPELDERRLAKAIDIAGAYLEPNVWHRFLERLRAALQDRAASNR
jgi:predicted component of type VI protein secretion system